MSGFFAAPAVADDNTSLNSGDCKFGTNDIKETPWSLQRLLTEQMWAHRMKGQGVKVAVIDTGVDMVNSQLKPVIGSGGQSFVGDKVGGGGKPTIDQVGHGTKVAGIIAARPKRSSGFFGLAPDAKIIPFKNTDKEKPGTAESLSMAIHKAVSEKVDVINISQGTDAKPEELPTLEAAVAFARSKDVLIVASAGNGGSNGGEKQMWPAAYSKKYDNVLAVAASDRNNERAPFSQSGDWVNIAAPGVNMVSTVPQGGNCVDQGTSFASPYAAGAAALLIAKHKNDHDGRWKPREVIWHLEQTAERVKKGPDKFIGWGVVDPVAALNDMSRPTEPPQPDKNDDSSAGMRVQAAALTIGESPTDRRIRFAIYIVGGALLAVGTVVGSAVALRDWRRKTGFSTHGEA
ncbi:type VII secretion-associated serine protease mycosin [Streptomyces sp. NPDC053427]|uniref:type VII secretion-associated serine protease mycosin n=1 Tax=Streptomyces sp. NPDC053427 TaxID=3365701 RepID=UPI0037D3783A